MNKILKIISSLLKNPGKIRRVLLEDKQTLYKQYVIKKFGLNEGLPTLDISTICNDMEQTVTHYTFLEGTSLPIDIALLKGLANKFSDCKYFEIGSWRGESLINLSTVAKQCYSLSLSRNEMKEMGLSNDFISLNGFFTHHTQNVVHLNSNSLTFNFDSLEKDFNLIFIDGDHSHSTVRADTTNALKIRNKLNGIIVWHDYGVTTERVNWEVLAGILDGCPKEIHKNLFHVSNTLCAILLFGDYAGITTCFPSKPNKYYTISLKQHMIDPDNNSH